VSKVAYDRILTITLKCCC